MASQVVAGLLAHPGVGEGLLSAVDRHGGVLGAGGDVLTGHINTPQYVLVPADDLDCRHGPRAQSGHYQLAIIVTTEKMKLPIR